MRIFVILLLLQTTVYGQGAQLSYQMPFHVFGNVPEGRDGEIYLYDIYADVDLPYRAKIAKDGSFALKGIIKYPGLYRLWVTNYGQGKTIYLDSLPVEIQDKLGIFSKSEVLGSSAYHQESMEAFGEIRRELYRKYQSLINMETAKLAGIDQKDLDSLSGMDRALYRDSLRQVGYPIVELVKEANIFYHSSKRAAAYAFMEKYPSTFGVIDAIDLLLTTKDADSIMPSGEHYRPLNREFLIEELDRLPKIIKSTPRFQEVYGLVYSLHRWKMGDQFPDLVLTNENLEIISTIDLIEQTKYTLIDFWASWCGPCIDEQRKIRRYTYDRYSRGEFEIIGVSIDRHKEDWLAALKSEDFPWIQLFGFNNPTINQLGIRTIPMNYLLDSTGKIIGANINHQALEKRLNELLRK